MTDPSITDLRMTAHRILAATPDQHITLDPRRLAQGVLALADEIDRLRAREIKVAEALVNEQIAAGNERARADRAEARLARVTDDAFEMEMEQALEAANRWDSGYADAAAALPVILAAIRAVAADEQEARR